MPSISGILILFLATANKLKEFFHLIDSRNQFFRLRFSRVLGSFFSGRGEIEVKVNRLCVLVRSPSHAASSNYSSINFFHSPTLSPLPGVGFWIWFWRLEARQWAVLFFLFYERRKTCLSHEACLWAHTARTEEENKRARSR